VAVTAAIPAVVAMTVAIAMHVTLAPAIAVASIQSIAVAAALVLVGQRGFRCGHGCVRGSARGYSPSP
jgi:hypothetical protein